MNLFSEAKKVIAGGVNSPARSFSGVGGEPLFFKSAKGAYIRTEDGRELIDYVGSWGPMILGHSFPPVLNSIKKAIENGLSFGAPTKIETKLAKNNTLFDFIKLEASERYHLTIKAQIIIKNDNGQTLASSTSSASWSQTVREDASYVERQKIWFNMVEKSMKKFDEKMNEAVAAYLGDYTL